MALDKFNGKKPVSTKGFILDCRLRSEYSSEYLVTNLFITISIDIALCPRYFKLKYILFLRNFKLKYIKRLEDVSSLYPLEMSEKS